MKTNLGVLLYSCHVQGHTVHSQPSSKELLKVNNSESMARYMLLGVLLYQAFSLCFVLAMFQIIYKKMKRNSGELDFSVCLLTEFVNRATEFDEVLLRYVCKP